MSIYANNNYSRNLQWTPETFGFENIDHELVDYFKDFQSRNRLGVDGICGPSTFKTWLQNFRAKWDGCFVWNGTPIHIPRIKVVSPWTWIATGKHKDVVSYKRNNHIFRPVEPCGVIVHNALTYNNESAMRIFDDGSYLPHFVIDVYGRELLQLFDPYRYKTFHVGAQNGKFNTYFIGIDNVNLLEMKYLHSSSNLHKEIGKFMLHKSGRYKERKYLKLHPGQINVCHDLIGKLCDLMDIVHQYPRIEECEGLSVLGDVSGVVPRKGGIWAHGMVQKNRWDGFDFMDDVKKI